MTSSEFLAATLPMDTAAAGEAPRFVLDDVSFSLTGSCDGLIIKKCAEGLR